MSPAALALDERAAFSAMDADPTDETQRTWLEARRAIARHLADTGSPALECWVTGGRYEVDGRGFLKRRQLSRRLMPCGQP